MTQTTQSSSGGPGIWITYTYSGDGQQTSALSQFGTWVGRAYNARHEVTQVQQWGGSAPNAWADYYRNLAGQVTARIDFAGTGARDDSTYDGAGRLNTRQTKQISSGANLLLRGYGYDVRDRRTWSLRDNNYGDTYEYFGDSQLQRYRYQVYRPDLNFWNPAGWTDTFDYDGAGNRTTLNENGTVTSYTANALNQYTAITGQTISHSDGRGNLTQFNAWSYGYDADNRLVSAITGGYYVYFYYDAEGRLLRVNRNGTVEHRYYEGVQCFFRCLSDGTWIDFMIWGPTPDELVSRWDAAHGGWSYFHYDQINSADTATDLWGNVVERYLYDPFGLPDIRDPSWGARASSALFNPWLFTGQEWLADLGLCSYKNRFYSPRLGRFIQNDPIRFDSGDLNLYRYCLNGPINSSDPMGLTVNIVSFTERAPDGSAVQRATTEQEKKTWGKIEKGLGNSEKGRQLRDKIEDPNYTLTVQSVPGDRPGGSYGDANSGEISLDLNDPTAIAPATRAEMYADAKAEGNVNDKQDFDNQVSSDPSVVAGHELGHAVENRRDEDSGGDNVKKVENPIRSGVGEKPREKYRQTKVDKEKKDKNKK